MAGFVGTCRHRAHRFAHHFQRGDEILIPNLQIMTTGDLLAVAQPGTDNVGCKTGFQIGLPARPQVVEQPGPGLHAGSGDRLLHRLAKGCPRSFPHEGQERIPHHMVMLTDPPPSRTMRETGYTL